MHIQGYQHIIESKSLVKVEGHKVKLKSFLECGLQTRALGPPFGVDDDTVVHPVHTYKQLTNYQVDGK